MPFIPQHLLDCAFYLYPSVEAAEEGRHVGGTGFFVGYPSEVTGGRVYLYCVTNRHVVSPPDGSPGAPVVRLNRRDGGVDYLDLRVDTWQPHPDGDDIAVHPVTLHDSHDINFVHRSEFLSQQDVVGYQLGPGDDCFMIGRFIYRDGQRNKPALRFGNIAMMPEPISQRPQRDFDQLSFVVEMRSIGGFSGSAVVVYYSTVGTRQSPIAEGEVSFASLVMNKAWLLGVDWGNLPSIPNIRGDQTDRQQVNSGMSAVVPAWRLATFLDSEEFGVVRRQLDAHLKAENEQEGHAVMDRADDASSLSLTSQLMGGLLQVPKDEADQIHREHL